MIKLVSCGQNPEQDQTNWDYILVTHDYVWAYHIYPNIWEPSVCEVIAMPRTETSLIFQSK